MLYYNKSNKGGDFMSKSLYSLILDDEVIEIVDKMARVNGVSRSNMIEKILANAVGYETPQIRANSVFGEIERILAESRSMRYLAQPSKFMASIMSALDYRYNPQIKYSVELFPNSDKLGQLKVILRTQNTILLELMSDFYKYYAYLERTYYNKIATYFEEGNKFIRLLDFPSVKMTSKELAEQITLYVKDFDELLNLYFNNLTSDGEMLKKLEKRFVELKANRVLI